jgi:hypothetical protein
MEHLDNSRLLVFCDADNSGEDSLANIKLNTIQMSEDLGVVSEDEFVVEGRIPSEYILVEVLDDIAISLDAPIRQMWTAMFNEGFQILQLVLFHSD